MRSTPPTVPAQRRTIVLALACCELEALLDTKQQAGESHYGDRCEQLHAFIAHELDVAAQRTDIDSMTYTETETLDQLLFETVMASSVS